MKSTCGKSHNYEKKGSIMRKILDSSIKLDIPVPTFGQKSSSSLGFSFLVCTLGIVIPVSQVVHAKHWGQSLAHGMQWMNAGDCYAVRRVGGRSHRHWGLPPCQALYFILKLHIAFIPFPDPPSYERFFAEEETGTWNHKSPCPRERTNQWRRHYLVPGLCFQRSCSFHAFTREEAGIPISNSTSWYTEEAEQNLGHRL